MLQQNLKNVACLAAAAAAPPHPGAVCSPV